MTIELQIHFVSTGKTMSGIKGCSMGRVILFLGAPGSGKGTQSSLLAGVLDIPSLSTGDMLRAEAGKDTRAGLELRKILASGALVSDDVVCAAVSARLKRDLPTRGMILDGFPRTVKQAQCLDQILSGMGLPGPIVLHLDVPRERLLSRLTSRRHCAVCGGIFNLVSRPSSRGTYCEYDGALLLQREDDAEAVVLQRLIEFDRSSAPLVEYYSKADYHRIEADRDTATVSAELLSVVVPAEARAAA
jgi:adenylate kinase